MKKALFYIFAVSLLLVSCNKADQTILFYGDTCPHCRDLEENFAKLGVDQKFQYEKKEVYNDKANANLLGAKAGYCGLNTNNIGVPFLYAQGKCFVGVPDIEKYVSEKTGIIFEASTSAMQASGSGDLIND